MAKITKHNIEPDFGKIDYSVLLCGFTRDFVKNWEDFKDFFDDGLCVIGNETDFDKDEVRLFNKKDLKNPKYGDEHEEFKNVIFVPDEEDLDASKTAIQTLKKFTEDGKISFCNSVVVKGEVPPLQQFYHFFHLHSWTEFHNLDEVKTVEFEGKKILMFYIYSGG